MNQETIPDNNLPVYLQKYDVNILDDKKESVGKVLYTTVGAAIKFDWLFKTQC